MDIRKLSSKKFDKYDKKCNMIKKLILKDYVNDKFEFIRNSETLHIEIIINNKSKITLLRNNSYEEIKRHIEKKITVQHDGISEDCIICREIIQKNVTCSKCSNNYCGKCYINLFKNGKGVITCPHCRYSFGDTMPEYMVQMSIDEIKHKLGEY